MKLAIFDLDGTVLRGNSWHEFFWWSLKRSPAKAPGLMGQLALRKLGLISGAGLRAAALRQLRGSTADDVARIGRVIYENRLRGKVRPTAREEINRARAEGYRLVLATGAFDFLAQPLADELGVGDVVCSRLEFADGKCLGSISGCETRGVVKAEAVRAYFADAEIDWKGSRAYSDDVEDVPLWALVGEGVMVARVGQRCRALPEGVRVECWGK